MKRNTDDLKLVLISNRCISDSDANGRSLLNLLGGFRPDQLYQIYTSGESINADLCCDYFRLTNKDAVFGFFGKRPKKTVCEKGEGNITAQSSMSSMKSALTMYLRDFVWCRSRGIDKGIIEWLTPIAPDAIVLQLGDSSNLIHIALAVSRHFNIPIIVYDTEDYYFKEYDFIKGKSNGGPVYKAYHKSFVKNVKRLFESTKYCVCNCDGIKKLFDDEFGLNSAVIYTASSAARISFEKAEQNELVSYCGNLGLERHRSLIKISEMLSRIVPGLKLRVYGNAPTEEIKKELNECETVDYRGVVPYSEVLKVISDSRLLIHAEGFDPYIAMDTRYAFSTKISDYAACGVPFLVYAPATCEGLNYVLSNGIGFTASNDDELEEALADALLNKEKRQQKRENSIKIAEINHKIDVNGMKMRDIILSAVN